MTESVSTPQKSTTDSSIKAVFDGNINLTLNLYIENLFWLSSWSFITSPDFDYHFCFVDELIQQCNKLCLGVS